MLLCNLVEIIVVSSSLEELTSVSTCVKMLECEVVV